MIQINTSLPYVGYLDSQVGGRSENQDSCGYADTDMGLLVVVCDGMGGGPGGKTASSLAVQTIIDYVSSAPIDASRAITLKTGVKKAHELLLKKQLEIPALKGMGTTVVALLINDYSAILAHVGDSRIYQYRRGGTIFRTADHSLVADLVRAGTLSEEQARLSSQSNVINRALGHGEVCEVDITELPYEKNDRFLLCTDGIWGAMPQKQLVKLTARTLSLSGVIESTVIQVNENGKNSGGHYDNLTLVIIETRRNSKLKQKMSTKVRNLLLVLLVICCLSLLGNVAMYYMWKAKPETKGQQNIEKLIENKLKEKEKEMNTNFEKSKRTLMEQIQKLEEEKMELEEKLKIKKKESDKDAFAEEKKTAEDNDYADIKSKLDHIIAQLEELKGMQAGNLKKQQIQKLMNYIDKVKPELLKAGVNENDISGSKGFATQLTVDVAQRGPKNIGKKQGCEGHYALLIKQVSKIKENMK